MRPYYILAIIISIISGCTDTPYELVGDVEYKRGGMACVPSDESHWLLDMEAKTAEDSIYFSTLKLGRKLELTTQQMDTTSHVYSLLSSTCIRDSVNIKLSATEFYKSFYGQAPDFLDTNARINVQLWVRDKLTDVEHASYKKTFEQDVIQKYVKSKGWNANLDTATGIYFERLKVHKNERNTFQKVKVLYSIQAVNGQLISRSTKAEPFIYDKADKGVLQGIQLMINKLAIGESLRAIVPSQYAFGAKGRDKIPGYMPVIMEFELLEKVK